MASFFSSLLGRTKPYEPSPRYLHYAAPVGGRCFLWGGRVPDFSDSGKRKLASTVETFNPYLEVWEQKATSGDSPLGLYGGACAPLSDLLYSFGGYDGASYRNSLHALDPTSLKWKEVRVLNPADGPMRRRSCRMVAYGHDKLALFGGFGIPTGCIQPGATFAKITEKIGYTNELHMFNVNEGLRLDSQIPLYLSGELVGFFSRNEIMVHLTIFLAHSLSNNCFQCGLRMDHTP